MGENIASPIIQITASPIVHEIVKGYGREHRKEYVQFLRIAQGSLKELETHLILAGRIGYLTRCQAGALAS